jgi:hypothetical protein
MRLMMSEKDSIMIDSSNKRFILYDNGMGGFDIDFIDGKGNTKLIVISPDVKISININGVKWSNVEE